MINSIKINFNKLVDRVKLILIVIGIFSIFRFCYTIDDKPVQIPTIKKKVTKNKSININTNSEFTNKITIDQTNQNELKRKHISKYSSKGRVIEPVSLDD